MIIQTDADICALEAKGYDTVYPDRTPWDILRRQAKDQPGAVAIQYIHDATDPGQDERVTYADLAGRVMGAARLFRANGVTADKSVAILAPHTVSAQVALWGAQVAGRACPINPALHPEHIAALFRAADVGAVVVLGANAEVNYWSTLIPALREQGLTLPIFACDADRACPGGDGIFEQLIAQPGDDITPEGDETALAAYYHTGGTTGAPKLVQHTRGNEAHVARSCALLHDLGPDDVVINGFPLFHVAGAFVYGLSVLSAGGTLVVPGRLGMRNAAFMKTFWKQVERLGVTTVGAVPTILASLKATPVDANISSLKWLLTGGSPLPTELADATEKHTGVPVRNILGMTESAGAISVEAVHAPRTPLSCGLRMPFSELAVFGETDGEADPSKPLPVGETGIVALRGPNVAAGYSDPARNAGVFLDGGWLISGDLGRVDAKGRLFIVGRKKDVIIRGAHNIDPQMIEDAILGHPDILNAAAVGMPDAYAGELPVVFATLRAGSEADERSLIDFLKTRIEDPVAVPKRIGLVENMPMTPIGKIFKPQLRAEAIRWALTKAGEEVGVTPEIAVDDKLKTLVSVPADKVRAMRDAIAGMPITVTVEAE